MAKIYVFNKITAMCFAAEGGGDTSVIFIY